MANVRFFSFPKEHSQLKFVYLQ